MRLLLAAPVVLLSLSLSAWASYTRTHQVALSQQVASFSGVHEFPYQAVSGRHRIEIGPGSFIFDFDDGRSYFVARLLRTPMIRVARRHNETGTVGSFGGSSLR